MALNFPNNPTAEQIFTSGDNSWRYNGAVWEAYTQLLPGPQGPPGPSGAVIAVSDTAPTDPTTGDLWWESSTGSLRLYYTDADGSQWVDAINVPSVLLEEFVGTGPALINISDVPPGSPAQGELWWDSSTGSMRIYYGDVDSAQWVDVISAETQQVEESSGTGSFPIYVNDSPPSSAVTGDLWWDSFTGSLRVYYSDADSAQWVEASTATGPKGADSIVPGPTGPAGIAGPTGPTGAAAPQNIPNNSKTTAYTLTIDDVGELINSTAGNITIPANVFSAGDIVTIYNNSTTDRSVLSSGVTTYLVGSSLTGTRTLSQRGLATVVCVGTNTFVISGGGLK